MSKHLTLACVQITSERIPHILFVVVFFLWLLIKRFAIANISVISGISLDLFALNGICRMGGIPCKTHKDEKLLIFLGIIDILQSYR